MSGINRRSFLKAAAAAASVFPLCTIAGTRASGKVLGANDVVRVAVAGLHGYGGKHIKEYLHLDGVQVTHLIDPDSSLFDVRRQEVRTSGGNDPKCLQDVREALDDDFDAISIVTPNHWHALMTIWACQAGKHVYLESPMTHNVFEGMKCVEAVQKYGRIVQHGTHLRSDATLAGQIAAIRSGAYGNLLVAKARCYVGRKGIGFELGHLPPASLNFDLWLGPAPIGPAQDRRFHRNLVHHNWRWFWDCGDGDIGDRGIHQLDVARWALAGATVPRRTWSLGGRFLPRGPDQAETPNVLLAVYEYDHSQLVFELCNLADPSRWEDYPSAPPMFEGCEFVTTEGVIRPEQDMVQETAGGTVVTRPAACGWKFFPNNGNAPEPVISRDVRVTPGGPFGSFITAVRNGESEDINAGVEEGCLSSALCHLANISYRSGRSATFDSKPAVLGDDKHAIDAFDRVKENLQGFGFELDDLTYRLGSVLTWDPATGAIVGDENADTLLQTWYRAPFYLPDEV